MKSLKETLMERDDLTDSQADELICAAQARVRNGDNPEDVLQEDFGLESDYLFGLIENIYEVK